jgi:uncharacterized protein (DUF885 family)
MYADPTCNFGRLQMKLHRAIRVVVDIRLNRKRWSSATATKYVEYNSTDALGGIV